MTWILKTDGSHNVPSWKGRNTKYYWHEKLKANQGISLSHLLDKNSIQKITENICKKVWENFISFGNASAEIIKIYFCIRIAKLIIDIIIHGYAIHTIYGWSLHLIGAFWDSVTNLIIYLSRKPKKEAFQEEATSYICPENLKRKHFKKRQQKN